MYSNSSFRKTAASIPASEVIDVDLEEPIIASKVCTDERSSDINYDLTTRTEDGSENEKHQNPRDGQPPNFSTINENVTDEQKTNSTKDDLVDDSGENNITRSKRQRIKLEDVRNFDILLPNQKNCSGVRIAKKDFYDGFVWYRKLIDKVRPAFMKCSTIEEKFKVSKWLIKKAEERGGRFLKENGDGTSGVCRVMTLQDTLKYTMVAFEDEKPWTTIASFLEGKKEADPSCAKPSQEIDLDGRLKSKVLVQQDIEVGSTLSLHRSHTSLNDILEAEISNSEQEPFAKTKTAISDNIRPSSEPPAKKSKILATAAMPLVPTSLSNPDTKAVHNGTEKALKGPEPYNSSLALQNCLMERQMIREELIENKEILLMRQERLSRLEAEFRLFQNPQLFLPSEKWLSEKILRQEELFENRELLGIQQQRCRRLQTLMELNERQVIEHQSSIEREKLKVETLQNVSKQEYGVREVMNKMTTSQHAQPERAIENELIGNTNNINNVKTTLDEMRKQKMQQQLAAQRMIDQHVALEVEMNRRAALDKKKAMEQEIEYRLAMERAVQRQVEMRKAIEARQLMMVRAGLSHHFPEIPTQGASKSIEEVKNISPDVADSMGETDDTKREKHESENEIIIGSDQGVPKTLGEVDGSDVEEADDDDSIVI